MTESQFWEQPPPWSFLDVPPEQRPDYLERRRMRYQLQDYMMDAIKFWAFNRKKVLEVGSGSGIDAAEFARFGASVTATDYSESALMATAETNSQAGSRVRVLKAKADNLPFDGEEFDLVYSFGILHHLKHPEKAVKEAFRVLRRGGEYLIMVYNRDSLLYAYSIEHLGLGFERHPGKAPDTRAFTQDEIVALLETQGFVDVKAQVCFDVVDLPNKRKVKFKIEGNPPLGWHIVCKGFKP